MANNINTEYGKLANPVYLQIGDIIMHDVYGSGKILSINITKFHKIATILFRNNIKKKFAIDIAKLSLIWSDTIFDNEIKPGYIVNHKMFGNGKVIETIEGNGDVYKIVVMFGDGCEKVLIPKYADLTIVYGK